MTSDHKPKAPMEPPKRGRGKPRRGRRLSQPTTVSIDPESFDVLRREFGSLGNALYYLATGIRDFRDEFDLPPHREHSRQQDKQADGFFTQAELKTALECIDWRLDYCEDRGEARSFLALKAKVEKWLRKRKF